jgi:hypothetical protein
MRVVCLAAVYGNELLMKRVFPSVHFLSLSFSSFLLVHFLNKKENWITDLPKGKLTKKHSYPHQRLLCLPQQQLAKEKEDTRNVHL